MQLSALEIDDGLPSRVYIVHAQKATSTRVRLVVYPTVGHHLVIWSCFHPASTPERKRQQLGRIRNVRKNTSRGGGVDHPQKKKPNDGAPQPASTQAVAKVLQPPSHDDTSDDDRKLSEDQNQANSPDEPVCADGVGADTSGVVGGAEGVRTPGKAKAGMRGRHAEYSDEALAERMAHLLSQRFVCALHAGVCVRLEILERKIKINRGRQEEQKG